MNQSYEIKTAAPPVWAQGVDARAAFIINTYVHLLGAILLFAGIEIAIFKTGSAEAISQKMLAMPGGWLLVLGLFMVVSWIARGAAHTAQSMAAQYAALGAYVGAYALIFIPLLWIADKYFPGVISTAALATIVGFTGLTGIAWYSRKDFSFLRGFLAWGGLCALLLIVAGVIFGFTLGPVFSVAMICFAGAAILYDTSNVMRHYPQDRYVAASIELFASVALMFWYVLRLLMALRD